MTQRRWKLFCFPYAGGSAGVFHPWKRNLDKNIELVAVELAGRGKRIYEPLYHSIAEAVEDVYSMIKNDLNGSPFGFFGHSMGGIIAFETAQKLRRIEVPEPSFIFFSGRGAPHVSKREDREIYHKLPHDEFKEKILGLGGTPKEFFEHPELLEALLPTLRSDFTIAETYESSDKIDPFDIDINVLIGKEEDVTAEQMHGWKDHTTKRCTMYYFDGGHFFINEKSEEIVGIINNTVKQLMKASR